MTATARDGERPRVPEPLYRKRYHEGAIHRRWWSWPDGRRARAWVVQCADLLERALAIEVDRAERRMLWLAAADRVVANRACPGYAPRGVPHPCQAPPPPRRLR